MNARVIGTLLILASIAALAVSVPRLAVSLRQHNQSMLGRYFSTREISPEHATSGLVWQPYDLRVDITPNAPRGEGEPATLDLSFRGEERTIVVGGPFDERLPGLAQFRDDRVRLLYISEVAPGALDSIARREAPDTGKGDGKRERLVLAIRHDTPESAEAAADAGDHAMKAIVDRGSWWYELIELNPPSVAQPLTITTFPYKNPRGASPDDPGFVPSLVDRERTWEYGAALVVTPKLKYPKHQFADSGLTQSGWWMVAGAAVLALMGGLIVLSGSLIRRPHDQIGPVAAA